MMALLTCAFLAGKGEVVVTWDIVPLAIFMPDHYHTVLSRREETIWLIGSPVLILLQEKEKSMRIVNPNIIIGVSSCSYLHLFITYIAKWNADTVLS